ncbi:MAG: hypothetical protein PVF58_05565 [Candidatus Methanofastidiosia archaeon]|jgi:hypothetical protein
MIKLIAVTVLLAAAGSSISEFSLSPGESFTLHCEHDYVFELSRCGETCVSLEISQIVEGTPQWTGHLFDLKEQQKYPVEWEFDDVVFDSVYVVRTGDITTLRVSYYEPVPVLSQERVVKANTEQQKAGKTSMFIVFELGAVIFLIFLVIHRVLYSNDADREPVTESTLPAPVVGFHDWQEYNQMESHNIGREMGREVGLRREKERAQTKTPIGAGIPRQEEDEDLELLQHIKELEKLKDMEMKHRMRRIEQEEDSLGLDWV